MSGASEPDSRETSPRDQVAAALRDVDAYQEVVGLTRDYLRTLRLSDPPGEVLQRVSALVEEATGLLAAHPGDVERMHGATGPFVPSPTHRKDAGEEVAWHFSFSPVVGLLDPQSPVVEMTFDGERICGRAVLDARFGGPPHTVHGGVVALVFDELLGNTNYCLGLGAMTGTLQIRYRRPTPLDRELELAGWLDRIEGRKVFTRGTISVDDQVTASAEAVFVQVDRATLDFLQPDR